MGGKLEFTSIEVSTHIKDSCTTYISFNLFVLNCIGGSMGAINYAGTILSCAGIQRWKSVSFHCWTAKNLVGESRKRRMTPHPLPTPPLNGHPELVRWAMRRRRKMTPTPYPPTPKWSSRVGEMSNEEEEEDDPHPLPTHPQMVIQSWWDEQWGGGGWPPPLPTHPQMVIQSWWDEQWGGGGRWPPPPTHPKWSSLWRIPDEW